MSLEQQIRFNRILLALAVIFSGMDLWLGTGSREVFFVVFGVGVACSIIWGRLMLDLAKDTVKEKIDHGN